MKWVVLLISICLSVSILNGQDFPDVYFSDTELLPCRYDSTIMVEQFKYWEVYQTIDDKWDGVIDSTICIGLDGSASNKIKLDNVDSQKTLFIRSKIYEDSLSFLLAPSDVYSVSSNIVPSVPLVSKDNDLCTNGLCNGVIVVMEVPNENNTGFNNRESYYPYTNPQSCGSDICLVTERFDHNRLKEYIIKLSFEVTDFTDETIWPFYANLSSDEYLESIYIDSLIYTDENFEGNGYYLNYYDFPTFEGKFIVRNNGIQYPSSTDPYFLDAQLVPNVAEPQQLYINLSYFTLHIQPFTILRGALVDGSDSIRHQLTIFQEDVDFCFSYLAELVIGGGTTFKYTSGSLDLAATNSCIAIKDHGRLEIVENSSLHLGNNGNGILMLGDDAEIKLNDGTTLNIEGKLFLNDTKEQPKDVEIHLTSNTSLTFGEYAKVGNHFSNDKRLRIYMEGGHLDISKLDKESKSIIDIIYPDEIKEQLESVDVLIFPNPVKDNLQIYSDHLETTTYTFYDLQGRQLLTGSGLNASIIRIEMAKFQSGMYILELTHDGVKSTHKVLKE